MINRKKLIQKYALDVSVCTLERLDQIVRLENIENGWNLDSYISFDVVSNDYCKINFGDTDKDIYFQRINHSGYFKIATQ